MGTDRIFGSQIMAALNLRGDWQNVLAHAADLAIKTSARLHLVSVVEGPVGPLAKKLGKKASAALVGRVREDLEIELDRAKATSPKDLTKVTSAVREGKPYEEILAEANAMKGGLMVVGAIPGRPGTGLFLRTNPLRLVRMFPVPVLAVGPSARENRKRILVPTALDKADQSAAEVALRLAAIDGARVSLLHVHAHPSELRLYSGDTASLTKELRAEAKAAFAAFANKLRMPAGSKPLHKLLESRPESSDAALSIVTEAARLKMDLVVMTRGSHSFLQRTLIGSTAERVFQDLPCSLLALPGRR